MEIDFDARGKVIGNDFYKSVIKSKYRMTYTDVNKIFEGDEELIENTVPFNKNIY